jgi:hypothetical protein
MSPTLEVLALGPRGLGSGKGGAVKDLYLILKESALPSFMFLVLNPIRGSSDLQAYFVLRTVC